MIQQLKVNILSGKKIILTLLILSTLSYAGLIGGIALIVNDEAITVYDIEKLRMEKKLSKEESVSRLIDKILFEQLVKKNHIAVDTLDINNYLRKVATLNGMNLYTFKSILKQKYEDYGKYERNVKKLITKQKLTNKLVRGNIKIATQEDLKIYYENNKDMFKYASKIKAVQYISPNKNDLQTIISNPMANIQTVKRIPIDLEQKDLNSQLRYVINETKANSFTPILTSKQKYVSLFIKQKENEQTIPFDSVKDRVFSIVMQDREKKYLKDYFEKAKISADIKIIR